MAPNHEKLFVGQWLKTKVEGWKSMIEYSVLSGKKIAKKRPDPDSYRNLGPSPKNQIFRPKTNYELLLEIIPLRIWSMGFEI